MKKEIRLTFNIKQTAELLVPDKIGRISYTVGLVLTILMIGVTVLLWAKIPARVPIYMSLPWGEIRLANKLLLLELPGLGILVMGINIAIAKVVGKLSQLLPRILSVGSGVVVVMLTLSLLGILQSILL